MDKVSVKVPASTANLGPGFDVFGLALALYNTFTVQRSTDTKIEIAGIYGDSTVPIDKDNLFYRTLITYYNHIGRAIPQLHILIDCGIPLESGLGSSSTAIIGALCAANKLENDYLSTLELATLAAKIEGHPDNTTPALLGGFVIGAYEEGTPLIYRKYTWPEEWKILIAHPIYKLPTKEARKALPESLSYKETIFNIGRASFLAAAVLTNDKELLREALKDKIHQPYRAQLVPGLNEIITVLNKEPTVLGTTLSGAGPSICVIHTAEDDSILQSLIQSIFEKASIKGEYFSLSVESEGTRYF